VSRTARLEPFLGRHRRIGIDTAPLIYHLEGDDKYLSVTTALFTWLQGRAVSAVTATLTLAELLVQPYRMNDPARVSTALAATVLFGHLEWEPLTLVIADRAAQLRVNHGLRTPDAIQLATALVAGATGFVTNDLSFRRIKEIDVLVLDDVADNPDR
jgi:predicted nucleic acid-binding protein